jgi:hypothetical protein
VSRFMDGNNNMQGVSGTHIWLRYETQFDKDGRKHTLEMSVPVPIGASAETRERLFREAEEGLQQLVAHVDQHALQLPQRSQNVSAGSAGRMAPQPAASTKPTPVQQTTTQRTPHANRPASVSAPQTSIQPVSQENTVPERVRPNGVTLPSGEPGSNVPLPQFIQYIKDNLGLTPKQAMEILNVRSLTTGVNLREALEQLKAHVGQSGPSATSIQAPTHRDVNSGTDALDAAEGSQDAPSSDVSRLGPLPRITRNDQTGPNVEMRVPGPSVGFDEELDLEDLVEPDESHAEFDDLEDLSGDAFSEVELNQAHERINALRAIQGAAVASSNRIQALNNVVMSQINQDQLQALIIGIWNIASPKKLKVDQVEELISWAKREDDFIQQVEAILKVLEEGR